MSEDVTSQVGTYLQSCIGTQGTLVGALHPRYVIVPQNGIFLFDTRVSCGHGLV